MARRCKRGRHALTPENTMPDGRCRACRYEYKRSHYVPHPKDRTLDTLDRNPNWKGEEAGYSAFHKRVVSHRGKPKRCDVCGLDDPDRAYDWANLSGQRDDLTDYARMCRPCHRRYDYERSGEAASRRARNVAIVARRAAGASLVSIARDVGLTPQQVGYICKRWGAAS